MSWCWSDCWLSCENPQQFWSYSSKLDEANRKPSGFCIFPHLFFFVCLQMHLNLPRGQWRSLSGFVSQTSLKVSMGTDIKAKCTKSKLTNIGFCAQILDSVHILPCFQKMKPKKMKETLILWLRVSSEIVLFYDHLNNCTVFRSGLWILCDGEGWGWLHSNRR